MNIGIKIKQALKSKAKRLQKLFYRPAAMEKRARKCLNSLIKKKDEDTIEVIMGYGIGDALFCAAYLKNLKVAPFRYIKVIAPKRLAPILRTYSFIDKYQFVFTHGNKMRCLNYILHDESLKQRALKYNIYTSLPAKKQPIGMLEHFEKNVYKLSSTPSIEFHNVVPGVVTAIENFESNYKKIVVLNPYSNSINIDKNGGGKVYLYFEKVSRFLQERGFQVYTNVINDQKAVKGSLELRCSLAELYAISLKIPLIVSVRSGILDFIVKSNINMFVLYDGDIGRTTYTLSQWQCNGKYAELLLADLEQESKLESFESFIKQLEIY